jgi:hypothetical protein
MKEWELDLISELMDEIFFVPQGFHSRLDDSLTLQVPGQPHPVLGTASIGAGNSYSHRTRVRAVIGLLRLNESTCDDGFTPSEFRLLAQQACGPELAPRDRSNAASMLIHGVRGEHSSQHRGYPNFPQFHIIGFAKPHIEGLQWIN